MLLVALPDPPLPYFESDATTGQKHEPLSRGSAFFSGVVLDFFVILWDDVVQEIKEALESCQFPLLFLIELSKKLMQSLLVVLCGQCHKQWNHSNRPSDSADLVNP
jgi:hypothetical protein